jgi:hypothetical protein
MAAKKRKTHKKGQEALTANLRQLEILRERGLFGSRKEDEKQALCIRGGVETR